jgi:hypothetical protein
VRLAFAEHKIDLAEVISLVNGRIWDELFLSYKSDPDLTTNQKVHLSGVIPFLVDVVKLLEPHLFQQRRDICDEMPWFVRKEGIIRDFLLENNNQKLVSQTGGQAVQKLLHLDPGLLVVIFKRAGESVVEYFGDLVFS